MNQFKIFFKVLLCLFFLSKAKATTLDLSTSKSDQTQSSSLGLDGDFNESIMNWSASVSQSKTKTTNPTSGETITDTTRDYSAGFGFSNPNQIYGNLSLSYSATPEENILNLGPTASIGYTYKFEPKTDADTFKPAIGLNLKYGQQNYIQTFTPQQRISIKAGPKPTSGNSQIIQRLAALAIKIKPVDWFQLKLTSIRYSYSKDVAGFLQNIDSQPVQPTNTSGLSNALSGFYESTFDIALIFYLFDDWELDLTNSSSKLSSDQSTANSNEIEIGYDINNSWKISIATLSSKSSNEGSEAATNNSLYVSYSF